MKRLAVLISGNGSNLQAIVDAIGNGTLEAQIAVVVSNCVAAYGLRRAADAQIPTLYFPLASYTARGQSRRDYDAGLAQQLAVYEPDLVVLAGWMHVLGPAFLDRFPGRVINLHPALPGELPGTDAIRRAYDASRRRERQHTGVMVHRVIPEVDAGPVIVTARVPIHSEDSLDDLEARVHAVEHTLLVDAIRRCLEEER